MKECFMKQGVCLVILALVLGGCPPWLFAAGAPNADEIRLGMSTVLSGPAGNLGEDMRQGVLAGLERTNRAGGIHGRRISLIALDDGYEPALTAPNMRELIETDHVLAIIGNVGTPTAIAAIPICDERKTVFFAPFSGAGMLHKIPPDRYVFNYRASYAEETAAIVKYLVEIRKVRPEEIAVFAPFARETRPLTPFVATASVSPHTTNRPATSPA